MQNIVNGVLARVPEYYIMFICVLCGLIVLRSQDTQLIQPCLFVPFHLVVLSFQEERR